MRAPALLTLTPSTSTPTLLTLTPAQAFLPCSHTLCTHPLTLHAQYTYSCLAHPLTSQMCTHGLSVRSHLPCTLTPCMCAQPLHVRSHPARTLSLVLLLVPCTRASWCTFRGASLAQPHFNSPQTGLFPALQLQELLIPSCTPEPQTLLMPPSPWGHAEDLGTLVHSLQHPCRHVSLFPPSRSAYPPSIHPSTPSSIRLSICLTPSHARCWAPFFSLFISGSQLLLAPPRCSLHPSFSPSLAPAASHHGYRSLAHIPPPSLPPSLLLLILSPLSRAPLLPCHLHRSSPPSPDFFPFHPSLLPPPCPGTSWSGLEAATPPGHACPPCRPRSRAPSAPRRPCRAPFYPAAAAFKVSISARLGEAGKAAPPAPSPATLRCHSERSRLINFTLLPSLKYIK